MKQLSTKSRYGLRALIDLAVNSNGTHVSLNTIAERQNISEIYLEQVFSSLRKSGIVKSVKGASGGYYLAKKPEDINVKSILKVLEGNLSVLGDKIDEEINKKNIMSYCVKINLWDKIDDSIDNLLESLTLADLVNEHRKLNDDTEPMFYI